MKYNMLQSGTKANQPFLINRTGGLLAIVLCLLFSVNMKAQFGSDIGATAVSSLTWDYLESYIGGDANASSIGLTTDNRMYVWGTNIGFTIHPTKLNGMGAATTQIVPYYVPSPAGETIKKVQLMGNSIAGSFVGIPTYFALSQSGKLYGWGVNTGIVETAWVVMSSYVSNDNTKAVRTPVQLTILGESSFVDVSTANMGNYWVAIGASGKAYHIGNAGNNVISTTYAQIPNPSGVTAGFKYTNVWTGKVTAGHPMIYLKGNNGKIYYTGTFNTAFATGVPSIFNYDSPVLTTNETSGQVRLITPREVPFPAGEDIVKMHFFAMNYAQSSNYAISASGKAYLAGFWRTNSSVSTPDQKYTIAPLKTAPGSTEFYKQLVGSDSVFYLKQFLEIAMPTGATKILDIISGEAGNGGANKSTLMVADNGKAYWSGSNLSAAPSSIMTGNYLTIGNSLTATQIPDNCNNIVTASTNNYYNWTYEAINYHGAVKLFRQSQIGSTASFALISKTGRGYWVGEANTGSGLGKIQTASSIAYNTRFNYPTPIANEQLLDCQTSAGTGGSLIAVTNTAVGTLDCSKTQIVNAPKVGTPSTNDLVVTINVTTAGSFTPLSISGSGFSLAAGTTYISTATTGIQQFHIPVNYDGSALGSLTFTVGSAGSCTANLSTLGARPVNKLVLTLDNCAAITPGTISK